MPEPSKQDEPFYVGYLPAPRIHVRAAVLALIAAATAFVTLAFLAASMRRDPGSGVWDDGKPTVLRGVITTDPFPLLHLTEPCGTLPSGAALCIVEMGKHGARDRCKDANGRNATVSGFLIQRSGRTMVELEPGPAGFQVGEVARTPPREVPGEEVVISGEIVDSKCWSGAMKPGDGRVHRECAIRCVTDGIPPMLVGFGQDRPERYTLVARESGVGLDRSQTAQIGLPVTVRGRLNRIGTCQILRIASDGIGPERSFDSHDEHHP